MLGKNKSKQLRHITIERQIRMMVSHVIRMRNRDWSIFEHLVFSQRD